MSSLSWILSYLFDCAHPHITWPRHHQAGFAYVACLDCGRVALFAGSHEDRRQSGAIGRSRTGLMARNLPRERCTLSAISQERCCISTSKTVSILVVAVPDLPYRLSLRCHLCSTLSTINTPARIHGVKNQSLSSNCDWHIPCRYRETRTIACQLSLPYVLGDRASFSLGAFRNAAWTELARPAILSQESW